MSENVERKVSQEEVENLAGIMYDGYCVEVGGKAFNGDPLPAWSEFGSDLTKQKQANAWRVCASTALFYCGKEEPKETTFMERLINEGAELGEKITSLDKGLNSDGFAQKVGEYQFALLHLQLNTMLAYRQVLNLRIKDLIEKGN